MGQRIPFCDDCKRDNPIMTMIEEHIWLSVAKKTELLCYQCIEKRLGRKLTLKDLKPCSLTREMVLGVIIGQQTSSEDLQKILSDFDGFEFLTENEEYLIKIGRLRWSEKYAK